MTKKVAIIGAGPSGLSSAKAALEHGLDVTVFEKTGDIGGLWNPTTGYTWSGMRTNISIHTDVFPDFPWPEGTQEFPATEEMYAYLQEYMRTFNLKDYILFNTEVIDVRPQGGKWLISTSSSVLEFDCVIVACGIFTTPYFPPNLGENNYIHSSAYKNAEQFRGLNVNVVGASLSGVEIAADVATTAKNVIHSFRVPPWVIPRYIGTQQQPLDLVFYSQPNRTDRKEVLLKNALGHRQTNMYMATLCPFQTEDPMSHLFIDSKSTKPQYVAISDNYIRLVKEGRIMPMPINMEEVVASKTDITIYCTGFRASLPFFQANILNTIKFKYEDQFNPLVLYKTTWHPELPGIGFVGVYRGQYPQVIYNQAQWVAAVFSGKALLPDKKTMSETMETEMQIRDLPREDRPQFPHSDYPGHLDSIKQEVTRAQTPILTRYRLLSSTNKLIALSVAVLGIGVITASCARRNKIC